MKEDKLLEQMEKSSDRLHLVQNHVSPAYVPRYAVDRIGQLRDLKILPSSEQYVIVNTHSELAIDIALGSDEESIDLFNIVFNCGLSLGDGRLIQQEKVIETVDFYVLKPELEISERLRCYFQDGKYVANRVIVADLKQRNDIQWRSEGFSVSARSECVFVMREGSAGDKAKFFKDNLDSFFARNKKITHIVYKKLHRGNFGEQYLWDHRNAFSRHDEGDVDLTGEMQILGMGEFISFSGQKVRKHQFDRPISSSDLAEVLILMQRSKISPTKIYQVISGGSSRNSFRVEVEARGRNAKMETAHIARQLLSDTGVFKSAGVEFEVTHDRKISSRS